MGPGSASALIGALSLEQAWHSSPGAGSLAHQKVKREPRAAARSLHLLGSGKSPREEFVALHRRAGENPCKGVPQGSAPGGRGLCPPYPARRKVSEQNKGPVVCLERSGGAGESSELSCPGCLQLLCSLGSSSPAPGSSPARR